MLFMKQSPNAKRPKAKQILRKLTSFELLDNAREDQFQFVRLLSQALSLSGHVQVFANVYQSDPKLTFLGLFPGYAKPHDPVLIAQSFVRLDADYRYGTEPEARTYCFTSSIFATVRGTPRIKLLTFSANRAVLSSRSTGLFSMMGMALGPL
jgi:hypothetical protein